jgi:hypothetical protein
MSIPEDTGETTPGTETPPPPPTGGEVPPPPPDSGTTTPTPPPARIAPKRLRVIKALAALLGSISTADGDKFTMAGKVTYNRLLFGADVQANPPMLSIVEAPRSDVAFYGGEGGSNRSDKWTLMIQGVLPDTKRNDDQDQAYYLVQDVERRLSRISAVNPNSGNAKFPADYNLGDMISGVEIAPPVVRPPEAGVSDHVFFYLPIRVGISVEIGE